MVASRLFRSPVQSLCLRGCEGRVQLNFWQLQRAGSFVFIMLNKGQRGNQIGLVFCRDWPDSDCSDVFSQ